MTIGKWFDVDNAEHIRAWDHLCKTGSWPKGFIPEGMELPTCWSVIVMQKISQRYCEQFLYKEKDKAKYIQDIQACLDVTENIKKGFAAGSYGFSQSEGIVAGLGMAINIINRDPKNEKD